MMQDENKRSPEEVAQQDELDRLLAFAIAPVAVPAERAGRVRERLASRVAESLARHARTLCVRLSDGPWKRLKSGVDVKSLHRGADGNSVLIRLAPGASLPVHRHRWLEEGIVLEGRFEVQGGDAIGPGDYHMSPAGAVHGRISSASGGLAFLRGTAIGDTEATLRELAGGLLPFQEKRAYTVSAAGLAWSEVGEGVSQHVLWSDGIVASRFLRLAPGAALEAPSAESPVDVEVLAVSGESFVGDLLLRPGEFVLEPAGSRLDRLHSDVGAILFVRGPLA